MVTAGGSACVGRASFVRLEGLRLDHSGRDCRRDRQGVSLFLFRPQGTGTACTAEPGQADRDRHRAEIATRELRGQPHRKTGALPASPGAARRDRP